MSKEKVAGYRVVSLVAFGSWSLGACGMTSKNVPAPAKETGGSAGSAGRAEQPRGGAISSTSSGGIKSDGGRNDTDGGKASGSSGEGGAPEATGGAVGSSGGAPDGGKGGEHYGGSGVGGDGGAGGESGAAGTGTLVPLYFRAGARLKPRVFRSGDLEVLDAIAEQSWYDVETGERCIFTVGADGVERCFPEYALTLPTTFLSEITYSDPTCRTPALINTPTRCDGTTYRYITMAAPTGCGSLAYRIGEPREWTAKLYVNRTGSCEQYDATPGMWVWPLEELPLETFVGVKRVSRPRHPNLSAWVREGEDGSSEVVGFFDLVRKTPCFSRGLNSSPEICIPATPLPSITDTYADASCSVPILGPSSTSTSCPAQPSSAVIHNAEDYDACPYSESVLGVFGVDHTRITQTYERTEFGCRPAATGARDVQIPGAPLELSSLPKLERIEVGSGPLKITFYGFDGVPFLPAEKGSDTILRNRSPFITVASGEPCTPYPFADGRWRCVPTSFANSPDYYLYYESDSCTGEPLAAMSTTGECSGGSPARGMIVSNLGNPVCDDDNLVIDTREFGATSGANLVFTRGASDSGCHAWKLGAGNLFTTKALNPASVFAPMERKLLSD